MTDAELLQAIEARVRPTICETFNSSGGMTVEGRILQTDFETLLDLIGRVRTSERERCAQLHEQVNPASDDERLHHVPGAGAMGAVIQYRDLIRERRT
jgi:hypothetical protein